MTALDQFLKSVGKQPCLFNSFEFHLFVHYSGDNLTRQIDALLKLKPAEILAKYQAIAAIDIDNVDAEQQRKRS